MSGLYFDTEEIDVPDGSIKVMEPGEDEPVGEIRVSINADGDVLISVDRYQASKFGPVWLVVD